MIQDDFKNWLLTNKKISTKSAADVLSRLSRAKAIVGVEIDNIPIDEILMYLARQSEFGTLSVSVKSQLRRALKLYDEFRQCI